eukprot:scaffold19465_cov92-Isochrysis_galbana.AAC.4
MVLPAPNSRVNCSYRPSSACATDGLVVRSAASKWARVTGGGSSAPPGMSINCIRLAPRSASPHGSHQPSAR